MKIRIFLLIAIMIAGLLYCEEDAVAFTLKVKGNVTLTREDNTSKISAGIELFNRDILESGEESFAAIKFIDGSSIVKLFPSSILEINAQKKESDLEKKSLLKMGELWAKVTQQMGTFEIETPTTVVSVRGTKFLVSVAEDGSTTLFAFSGLLQLSNKLDDNYIDVKAGEKAFSSGEGMITVEPFQTSDLDEDIREYLEESSETLRIEVENENGDRKTIRIEME
ncbi:MAG: FecR domain-containing protein [Candidatus Cloacimonetes bacterium]|nr:FecR domain-containing protein [Candidatus Cloacimonadota bacterium]